MSDPTTKPDVWTVGRLLEWTRDFLQRKGVEQPQLCAQLLLAHALGCERLELYMRFDAQPEPDQLDAFRELVRQAAAGRPIAYLIGRKEFYSMPFRVTPDVLIPRPETETLVETVIGLIKSSDRPVRRVLELGVGSGCVAAAVASQLAEIAIVATDLSQEALDVARANTEQHGLADRVELRRGDLYDALDTSGEPFALIMSNPPYVKRADLEGMSEDVARTEPRAALDGGEDGLDVVRRIVDGCDAWLAPGGWLALEIGYDQADAVNGLFSQAGLADVRFATDGSGYRRVAVGRRP